MLSTGHTVSAAMMKSLPFDRGEGLRAGRHGRHLVPSSSSRARICRPTTSRAWWRSPRKSPGKLNFGTVGLGSTQHMAGELFRQMTGIEVKHIPYRGTPMVVQALRNKEIDYAIELVHAVSGQVDAGDLKLLAVGAPERCPAVPNVPTIAESGVPGYAVSGWYGLVFPAGTPQAIVDKMQQGARRGAVASRGARAALQGRRRGSLELDAGIRRAAQRRGRQVEEGARHGRACGRNRPAVFWLD